MNTLLLYPRFPDTFWSYKHALKFIKKRAFSPPLGLLTVAPMLPDHWEKRLIDLNVSSLSSSDLEWADYAFISGMVVQKQSARDIMNQCSQSGLTIVGGGPLFTSEYEQFHQVDYFVLDEAEITLPRFLQDLENDTPKHIYRAEDHPELSETPVPDWDLVDMNQYSSMGIQYSRGCPYNCEFCNVTALFGHRPRTKTADQIIRELNSLYERGWRRNVFFVDDNLIGHRKHLKQELLPALIEWRKTHPEIKFHTEVSINLADDDELVDLMRRAGFTTVFVGIETPDEESLREACKSQNEGRDLVADVKHLHHQGIQVQGGFIVGFDSDRQNIFQRQIEFIQQSGIVVAMVGLLQAPAGTKLYERLKEAGRLLGDMSGNNVDGTTNIIPKMGLDQLGAGYKSILKHIYAPKNYYRRIRTFLKDYSLPELSSPVRREDIMAFFRSVYQLGIKGKERFQYWKLVLWTLLRRPKHFPVAITLAIYGHHFRKITELYIL